MGAAPTLAMLPRPDSRGDSPEPDPRPSPNVHPTPSSNVNSNLAPGEAHAARLGARRLARAVQQIAQLATPECRLEYIWVGVFIFGIARVAQLGTPECGGAVRESMFAIGDARSMTSARNA